MARDHGRIRLDIWADEDWRALPSMSQWLYLHLVTSPTLNFCGVADWRPARIAAMAKDLDSMDVEYAAQWLEMHAFVVIDRSTEEALVRSWVKHDGLLASPNVTKAMVKAHGQIASATLRGVVVWQLNRIAKSDPDLGGLKQLNGLLERRSISPEEALADLPENPSSKGSLNPSANPLREVR